MPPASHCSPFAVSMMLLPQTSSDLQSAEQLSPEITLPSSQTSPDAVSLMPSPQRRGVQFVRHIASAAFEFDAPRSHSSPDRLSTILSPQRCVVQSGRHAAFGVFAFIEPLSHCSPLIVSMMALPHTSSDLQSAEQLSPDVVFPSSQISPVSRMLSPQRAR